MANGLLQQAAAPNTQGVQQAAAPNTQGVQQAVAQEMQGVQQADPGQQEIYNVFVKTCALLVAQMSDQLNQRMQAGNPVDSLAQIAVMIIERALDQLAKIGVQIPEDIIYQGGLEVLGAIHEELGLSMSDDEKRSVAEKATDLFLHNQETAGTLDTEGLAKVAEALKRGELPLEKAQ